MKNVNAPFAAGIRVHICGIFIPLEKFLAIILNTHHNLYFYLDMMRQIREAIRFGKLERFRSDLQARLKGQTQGGLGAGRSGAASSVSDSEPAGHGR